MRAEKIIYGTVCEILCKTGNHTSDRINFKATSDYPITEDIALTLQLKKGYHPAGYGFYNFNSSILAITNNKYSATWNCSASCD